MNLKIDNNNIEKSFDIIAKDLISNYALFVNNSEIRFTEIEFYYFLDEKHEDNYTHEHKRDSGEWRFHNHGIDITFQSDNQSDGGILIRGILLNGEYTNGPRKILREIFKAFGKVEDKTIIQLKKVSPRKVDIFKTFRHLPNQNKVEEFHFKPYRYLTDIEDLDMANSQKEAIKKEMIKI